MGAHSLCGCPQETIRPLASTRSWRVLTSTVAQTTSPFACHERVSAGHATPIAGRPPGARLHSRGCVPVTVSRPVARSCMRISPALAFRASSGIGALRAPVRLSGVTVGNGGVNGMPAEDLRNRMDLDAGLPGRDRIVTPRRHGPPWPPPAKRTVCVKGSCQFTLAKGCCGPKTDISWRPAGYADLRRW